MSIKAEIKKINRLSHIKIGWNIKKNRLLFICCNNVESVFNK